MCDVERSSECNNNKYDKTNTKYQWDKMKPSGIRIDRQQIGFVQRRPIDLYAILFIIITFAYGGGPFKVGSHGTMRTIASNIFRSFIFRLYEKMIIVARVPLRRMSIDALIFVNNRKTW